MTILRACIVCAKPGPESYCAEHKPKPWATSKRKDRLTVSGSAEQARRLRILERDLSTCHVCGKLGADQVDHRIPLAEGGADEEWNLASIHAEPCHRIKTAEESRRARMKAPPPAMHPPSPRASRPVGVAPGAGKTNQDRGR